MASATAPFAAVFLGLCAPQTTFFLTGQPYGDLLGVWSYGQILLFKACLLNVTQNISASLLNRLILSTLQIDSVISTAY